MEGARIAKKKGTNKVISKEKKKVKQKQGPKAEHIWNESAFSLDSKIMEIYEYLEHQPNCVAYIPIVNLVYQEIRASEPHFENELSIEGFRYYATCLLWIRIADIKRKTSQPLTEEESKLLSMTDTTSAALIEPIFLYLKGLGSIKTWAGQTLIPTFPALPIKSTNATHGGYFGSVDAETHNLYEEFPCLGVVAEALRIAASDTPARQYASSLAPQNATMNSNLQGYDALAPRSVIVRHMYINYSVTQDRFPESIPNTGFGFGIMWAIAQKLFKIKTFKVHQAKLSAMGKTGSPAQLVINKPQMLGLNQNMRVYNAEIKNVSAAKESDTVYAIAAAFCYQLIKESAVQPRDNPSLQSQTWCCVNYTGKDDCRIPQEWVSNKNIRRNMPSLYKIENFWTTPQCPRRRAVISAFKLIN